MIPFLTPSSGLHLKEAEDWHNICACAYTQLEVTCRKIISGDIIMDDLNEINLRKRQMIKLCTSSESLDVPSIEDLETNINARQLEYQYFTEFKKQLDHFTTCLKNVCVQGMVTLHKYFICSIIFK